MNPYSPVISLHAQAPEGRHVFLVHCLMLAALRQLERVACRSRFISRQKAAITPMNQCTSYALRFTFYY